MAIRRRASRRSGVLLATIVGFSGGAAMVTVNTGMAAAMEGSWAATGSLNQARIAQTATLLESGGVLVAGGRSSTACSRLPSWTARSVRRSHRRQPWPRRDGATPPPC